MKLNILIIGATPPPIQGAAIYFSEITNSKLLQSNYNLKHIDTKFSKDCFSYTQFTLNKLLLLLRYVLKFITIIIFFNPKIIFTQLTYSKNPFLKDLVFICLAKLSGCKVVITILGSGFKEEYLKSSLFIRFIYRRAFRIPDIIIVHTSSIIRRDWPDEVISRKTQLIPYGINPIVKKEEVQEKLLKEKQNIHVLFMSNFIESKGIFESIKAAIEILKTKQNVIFYFAGNWANSIDEDKANKILNYKKCNNIIFGGFLTGVKKREILLKTDIFLLPTYYPNEDMPLAILDAMSAGIAIVTTDHGGILDVITDKVNGLLCSKKDYLDLAEKILMLIENEEIRKSIQENNVNEFYDKYDFKTYENSLSVLFQQVNRM